MSKFRKKPVVIDAVQFDGTPKGAIDVFEEFDIPGGKFVPDHDLRSGRILIPTMEGDMHASVGDWIIKGVAGEFYPCKPDIFKATYEVHDHTRPRPTTEAGGGLQCIRDGQMAYV